MKIDRSRSRIMNSLFPETPFSRYQTKPSNQIEMIQKTARLSRKEKTLNLRETDRKSVV